MTLDNTNSEGTDQDQMTFYGFSSEGTNRKLRLIECPYMDYYRVPSNQCSSYWESTGVLTLSAKLFDNSLTREHVISL